MILNTIYKQHVKVKLKHITNLINIFEHYVMEHGNSLHDIAKLDLEHMIKEAIKDGFILASRS